MRAVACNYAIAQSPATAPSIAIKAAQCLGVATGWIGPTAGDITVDCMAMAFVVPIDTDPRALVILYEWVKTAGAEMNEAHLRMTRIPKGGSHPQQGVGGSWLLRRAQSNSA